MTAHALRRHPHRADVHRNHSLQDAGRLVWRVLFLAVGLAALALFTLFVILVFVQVIAGAV